MIHYRVYPTALWCPSQHLYFVLEKKVTIHFFLVSISFSHFFNANFWKIDICDVMIPLLVHDLTHLRISTSQYKNLRLLVIIQSRDYNLSELCRAQVPIEGLPTLVLVPGIPIGRERVVRVLCRQDHLSCLSIEKFFIGLQKKLMRNFVYKLRLKLLRGNGLHDKIIIYKEVFWI